MTLLIACLLIYNFNLSGWMYVAAVAIWALTAWMLDVTVKSNVNAILHSISQLRDDFERMDERIKDIEERLRDNFETDEERQHAADMQP